MHAPLKKKSVRANYSQYVTKALRKAIMRRSNLEKIYIYIYIYIYVYIYICVCVCVCVCLYTLYNGSIQVKPEGSI